MHSATRSPYRAATLKDVAISAGVHPSTVSRALDPARRHLIADDVAERISCIAERIGYRPDGLAASLRTGCSRLVGVLVPDIAKPVFFPIISGLSEALGGAGYSTIVADVGADPKRQRALVDELVARRVDGLVLTTVRRDDHVLRHCREAGVATVLVNRVDNAGTVASVTSDDRLGMALAVDHLVDLGHVAIPHLGGPEGLSIGAQRREGFFEAMTRRGTNTTDILIAAATAYDRDAGEIATHELLENRKKITAIVAANDLLALGALRALAARGLACPGDVSLTGHNDMPLVDQMAPPLTTVRIGPREMGREAARLLTEVIKGSTDGTIKRVVLRPTLMVRASTAPPKT